MLRSKLQIQASINKSARAKSSLDFFASVAKKLSHDLGDLELDGEHDQVVNVLIAHLALTVTLAESLR